MGMEDLCNTGLKLGLGSMPPTQKPANYKVAVEPTYLTLALSAADNNPYGRQGSPHSSALSCFSVKRERDRSSEEVEAAERPLLNGEEDDSVNNARKKLRLTKEQSALLEESFKHHSTLNPKQKQALARQLNLRPRQVEVWFQNRRARTKLKQTEVDCELLKKWCESLTEENRRLQKEVNALKSNCCTPFYMPSIMCPSCSERITITEGASARATTTNSSSPKHLYNPFINNPSAAC